MKAIKQIIVSEKLWGKLRQSANPKVIKENPIPLGVDIIKWSFLPDYVWWAEDINGDMYMYGKEELKVENPKNYLRKNNL